MSESKLPADPLALILGIMSLIISVGGCCLSGMFFPFAILAIVPIVVSVIGLLMANRSLKAYRESPEVYLKTSKDNVYTAKVLNLVTLIFGAIVFLTLLIGFITVGTAFYKIFDSIDRESPYKIEETESVYEYDKIEVDTIETDSTLIYEIEEIEKDTLIIDSLMIEEIKEIETIEN